MLNLNELVVLFNGYIDQSRQFLAELKPLVNQTSEEPEEGTKFSGKSSEFGWILNLLSRHLFQMHYWRAVKKVKMNSKKPIKIY
ncbi:Uncharacterised protein [Sphingobacterium daejeonense]|nr:Uncharacterised protein [Sphingobacterium daejeonense]